MRLQDVLDLKEVIGKLKMPHEQHADMKEVLRIVALYKALQKPQLARMFPQKQSTIHIIIDALVRQQRIFYHQQGNLILASPEEKPDDLLIKAVWVMLDFWDKVTFHSPSDFPVVLSFFTDEDFYELVSVQYQTENVVNQAMFFSKSETPGKRLVMVDVVEQIPKVRVDNTIGFCTVESDGKIIYYKRNEERAYEQQQLDQLDPQYFG